MDSFFTWRQFSQITFPLLGMKLDKEGSDEPPTNRFD